MEEKRAKWQNKSRKAVKLLNGYLAKPGKPFIANRSDIPSAFIDFFEQIKVDYQPPQADSDEGTGVKTGKPARTRTNINVTTADAEQQIADQIKQEVTSPTPTIELFEIRFVSAGWYDVIELGTDKVMNPRRLRKPQAEELCLQLNHPEE